MNYFVINYKGNFSPKSDEVVKAMLYDSGKKNIYCSIPKFIKNIMMLLS